ncbi:hypothetical protein [Coraliomargarita akajimensis]|uniref:Uncharacterized protein n=1 Tax=Coraliomargarita akajimensis (strain DSM 45221 / IAM 15411 / JCM 23193 / KCTC 12865 / 04OKA010-24) TaxID=583355 RepID=D5EQK7_CORAD|nr:hypothetical protein [Coraliomargarita akajimensis]ADE55821.1 conserved hypothetical protein [Coraliomargarita akajimensis DSM 45221]
MSDSEQQGDLDLVSGLFEQMGAESAQARTMASQLLKRAEQVAVERKISKIEATQTLLNQVIQARQGIAPGSDTGKTD